MEVGGGERVLSPLALPFFRSKVDFKHIQFEIEPPVARIILNRPPLHILDLITLEELHSALDLARGNPQLKVLILTGSGNKAFSAGVDIKDHLPDKVEAMIHKVHEVVYTLSQVEAVILAVVNGMALGGGCELVACCDLAIAASEAIFGQPEIKLGVFAPVASAMLPHRIGYKKASELLLTGDPISAYEAREFGLVNQVVPFEQLEKATTDLTNRLIDKSAVVLKLAKRALICGAKSPWKETLPSIETLYLNTLMKTYDAEEGLKAFLEKRRPIWKNQ